MNKPLIYFETDHLYVRSIQEKDKEYYMTLRRDTSSIAQAYTVLPEFCDIEWDNELNSTEDIYLAVFLKENGTFVASASYQGFNTDSIEIGFDVVKEYRNQGIGTELIFGMLKEERSVFCEKKILIKTEINNIACRRVIEKCGGVFCGYEPTMVAKAIESLMKSIETEELDTQEWRRKKEENAQFLEENKESVCIYRLK